MFISKKDYDKLVKKIEELDGEVNGAELKPTSMLSCLSLGDRFCISEPLYKMDREESIRDNMIDLIDAIEKKFDEVGERIEAVQDELNGQIDDLADALGYEWKKEKVIPEHYGKKTNKKGKK